MRHDETHRTHRTGWLRAAVLGANYPGSEWYQKAFELMQKHAPGTKVS